MTDRSSWARDERAWEPFMEGLRKRVRRERRRRGLLKAGAAGSVLLLAWLLVTLSVGEAGRRGVAPALLLSARIPSGDEPRFEPESGLVTESAGGVFVVREGRVP